MEASMSDDRFLERLRSDAAPLRYEPDSIAMTRLRARIMSRLIEPTPAQFIARWFRPLAASLSAIALAGILGMTLYERDATAVANDAPRVTMGGDVFSVVD
jgi:hypothetical protein